MRLVLYQPEIPQNVGALMRFVACMGIPLDIVEPCGFLFSDKHLKRAGMDYIEMAATINHANWHAFCEKSEGARRIAVTVGARHRYTEFSFNKNDALIMGQESSGLPPSILESCRDSVFIPMVPETRSLNLALSAAIVTTEALRQTNLLTGA